MKNKVLFTAILLTGLAFASFGTTSLYSQDPKGSAAMKDSVKYVCPHHPDMVSNKPGKCKCGMDLVAMNKSKIPKSTGMKKDGIMHDRMKKDTAMMQKGKM